MSLSELTLKSLHFVMDLFCSTGEFKSPSSVFQKFLSSLVLQVVQSIPFVFNYLPFFFGFISFSLIRSCYLELCYSELYRPLYLSILFICFSEILFFAYCLKSNKKVNREAPPKRPQLTKQQRADKIGMLSRSMLNIEHNYRGWLLMDKERMTSSSLNRNHILDWVGWALFGKSAVEMDMDETKEVEGYCVEAGLERILKVAPQKNQKPIRLFNQLRVPFQYIPLFIYVIVHILKSIGSVILMCLRFKHEAVKGIKNISYWVRYNKDSKQAPIVFCHGIGLGPIQYILFIYKLAQLHPNRSIVVLQLDYLTMNLVEKPVSREQHLKFFDSIFAKYNFTQAHWVSHSFGSFLMSSISNERPHLVQNLTFIDPVCFNLMDPFLVYRVYNGQLKSNSFQYILRYLIAYEFSVVRFFLRNLWWDEMIFFPDYLKNISGKVNVYLSEDDILVDYKTTKYFFNTYFNHANFSHHTIKDAPHGGCIFNSTLMESLLGNLS